MRRLAARLPFGPGHDTKLYRDLIHAARALRIASTPDSITGHVAALYHFPSCDTTTIPIHDTIFVSRHSLGQVMRARVSACPAHMLAVSWPVAALPGLLCHDTIPLYRDLVGQQPIRFLLLSRIFCFIPVTGKSPNFFFIFQ